jgi:hypothetical protein
MKLVSSCLLAPQNLPYEQLHIFLLSLGEANNALGAWGKKEETPLIWASRAGWTEIVNLFISHMLIRCAEYRKHVRPVGG